MYYKCVRDVPNILGSGDVEVRVKVERWSESRNSNGRLEVEAQ